MRFYSTLLDFMVSQKNEQMLKQVPNSAYNLNKMKIQTVYLYRLLNRAVFYNYVLIAKFQNKSLLVGYYLNNLNDSNFKIMIIV